MTTLAEATPVARPLAARPGSTQAAVPDQPAAARSGEYLSLSLGAECYGIDILCVQEIRSYEAPTRIAHASPFVRGVINLRGVVVPVLDLRLKLGCERADCDESTVVVVLNLGGRVVGAVVDGVSDVMELGADQIKPAPALKTSAGTPYITGIATVRQAQGDEVVERMLILLDIEALMAAGDSGLLPAAA